MILEKNAIYDDPKYSHLRVFFDRAVSSFWTPLKYENSIKSLDLPAFQNLPFHDQQVIRKCVLAIAMVEDKVKSFWSGLHNDIPQTVISDVGAVFGAIEAVHRIAYNSLNKLLKVDPNEYKNHKVLVDRLAYLNKHIHKDNSLSREMQILKNLVLFVALIEKCSLFLHFYTLMSYSNANRGMKAISSLQQTTSVEEDMHFEFGIALINIIKKEYPELWNSYLIEEVERNLELAYQSELKIIDWFLEDGVPEHLTRLELINFLNYNFETVRKGLGLDPKYDVDIEMYRERSSWMATQQKNTEGDFFHDNIGNYSSVSKETDISSIKF